MQKIGFGGSCHWCTEAIFLSFTGVVKVDQGWIASTGEATAFLEAVIVEFDPSIISLQTLIEIHLHSHSCTANHAMRSKYRSAVYTFDETQAIEVTKILSRLQTDFNEAIITQVLPFESFRLNEINYLNYYYSNPQKPFCENVVSPKLQSLRQRFGKLMIT
jgi:peptide-methionine (S)-S-oxide reductase